MSDPTALVAEWTAAMEGVPDGEIERAFIVDGYGEAIQGEAVLYLPDDNEAEFRGAHAEVISAWIARCSPAGIAPLLALIAQQAATIEAVTKGRDEVAVQYGRATDENTKLKARVEEQRQAIARYVNDDVYARASQAESRATAAEAERDRLVAEEREACAKLASDLAIAQPVYGSFCAEYCDGHSDGSDATQAAITAAIRARAALSTAKERGE